MLPASSRSLRLLSLALLSVGPSLASPDLSDANYNAVTSSSLVGRALNLNTLLSGLFGSTSSPSSSNPGGTTTGTVITPANQNGKSGYGMLSQLPLPLFKTGDGTKVDNGWPWGRINTVNTNPYRGSNYTAVVRNYNFTLSQCDFAPDGVTTLKVLCINDQFPGPLIEANYGDNISVTLTNTLRDQGTSMHWHGFLQSQNNIMDGVPGVTQCPIPPNGTMNYNFRAELYGSSWYHTHYSAQYAVGAIGPLVVYGPSESKYDMDLGPVMLQEWYRNDFSYYVQKYMVPLSKGGPTLPLASSNLINGKMRFPCSKTTAKCVTADYSKFNFTSGKNHRLRLVNTGASAIQKFAIDGHTMQVIANDFMPVKPYNVSMIALGVGQRADVIVFGSGKPTDMVWMRSDITGCSLNDGSLTEALAVIYYEKSDHKSLPSAPASQGPTASTDLRSCAGDPLTVTEPSYPLAVASNPYTVTLNITLKSNGTNLLFWMGNQSARVNYNEPVLFNTLNNFQTKDVSNAYYEEPIWRTNATTVINSTRVILYNYDDAPHPIHLHGHNMQVLNVGFGQWDGSIIRPNNPARRDVMVMPPGSPTSPSFLVIQWPQDNIGVWPLHCHFAWHSSMGLIANFVEHWVDITWEGRKMYARAVTDGCQKWGEYTYPRSATTRPLLTTGIDSGLKPRELFPGSGLPTGENGTGNSLMEESLRLFSREPQPAEEEIVRRTVPGPPMPYQPRYNKDGHEIY